MVIPALNNNANMAPHSGGMESTGFNINQGYPVIDWSNVPAPNIPANSTQPIRWKANCQFQQRPRDLESRNDTNNEMLLYCNQFFSSWREMPPPSDTDGLVNNTDQQLENVSPVDQQPFNYTRPITPPMPIPVTEIFSPNTVNEVRTSIQTLFPNGPPPPPPFVPVKRHKKGDTPYIVGCTERPRVPEKRTLSVFKGGDYGITNETNSFNDEECPTQRKYRKKNQYPNWSHSRFNPKSEEIAATLTIGERVDTAHHRNPSNDAVSYQSTARKSRPQKFCPLPSTSKDSETIMKNERQFSESLKYGNLDTCDDDDDDDLPDIQWEQNNIIRNLNHYSFESRDIKAICNAEPSVINAICDAEPSVSNEFLNNNNNNSSQDEVDFQEIQFDRYMPRKEFPVPTITTNDPIIIDEIDLDNINETRERKSEVTESIEIKDDYNSITYDELYSVPKATEPVNVDDLLKDLNNFHQKRKPVNQEIITIVDPADIHNSSYNQKAQAKLAKNVHNNINENVIFHLIANKESTPEVTPAAIETEEVIEVIDSVEPIDRLNLQPSTSDNVEFVTEIIIGDNRSTDDDSDASVCTLDDDVYVNIFRELCNFFTKKTEKVCRDRQRSRTEKPKKSQKKQPQKKNTEETVNNENAAPSTNGQTIPANGERSLGDCPICMDNLVRGAIASTTCGHVFCLSCIKKCLRTSGKKCPTCRKTLKGVGYHQVFL